MDQHNPMSDDVNQVAASADPWSDKAEDLVREFARTHQSIAAHHSGAVTHPGETSDMNAPLVNSVRHAAALEFVLELGHLADSIRRMEDRASLVRARQAQRDRADAYGQGVADGVEQGKVYQQRDQASAADRLAYGNPSAHREGEDVITPKGHVAAWLHVHEEPDGTTFRREVYGTLDADVREGDTRAVIVAGPDKHLISLDRVRFAPTLPALVAVGDLAELDALEVTDSGTAVKAVDAMDKGGHLEARIATLEEGENAEGSKPGTYVRLVSIRPGNGRVTLDLSPAQWSHLAQAVEILYGRRLVAQAEGDES
jgi:hypothetical protein